MKKIQPIIFTHTPDGYCLLESVGALLEIGMPAPYVYVHKGKEPPKWIQEQLDSLGCVTKAFVRPMPEAGQFGRQCLIGVAEAFMEAMAETGSDYGLKVDSDTVVLRTDWLRRAADDNVAGAGWSWVGWGFSGCFEMLRRDVAKYIYDHGMSGKPLPGGLFDHDCPHDVVDGLLSAECGETRIWNYKEGEPCLGAGYQYHEAKVDLLEYARRFHCVTFGQRYLMEGTDTERRQIVAGHMSMFRTIARKHNLIRKV